jgi:hypothetical protein
VSCDGCGADQRGVTVWSRSFITITLTCSDLVGDLASSAWCAVGEASSRHGVGWLRQARVAMDTEGGAAVDVPEWAYVHAVRRGFDPDDPLFASGDHDRLQWCVATNTHALVAAGVQPPIKHSRSPA